MTAKKKYIPLPCLSPGVRLIDTHCHLDMEAYETDCSQVIDRARDAGVGHIITVGIDLKSSQQAVAIAKQYEGVLATIGVHPHNVSELNDSTYDELKKLAASPYVVAYGEIGMDTVKQYAPLETQIEHFKKQAVFAKELHLPLIVHDREAHDEIMAILQEMSPFPKGGVVHCFSGDVQLAQRVIELGFYVSIPGIVTFNKAHDLQKTVLEISIKHLVLETDGPYLAPDPRRGKRNEPALMLYTAQKVAEIKGISLDDVARQTTENACTLFGLKE